MIAACKLGQFPDIETMSKFGLTGYQGTNPIEVFEKYKKAVKRGVTQSQLDDALERGQLSDLIGCDIKIGPKKYHECGTCGFYSKEKICKCNNESNHETETEPENGSHA